MIKTMNSILNYSQFGGTTVTPPTSRSTTTHPFLLLTDPFLLLAGFGIELLLGLTTVSTSRLFNYITVI